MEIKECTQCGAGLRRLRIQRMWICPYCGTRYEDAARDEKPDAFGLNEEVFAIEGDLSRIIKKSGGGGVIRSIAGCMSRFESSAQVEDYLLNKIPFSDEISTAGVRSERIAGAMPVLGTVMEPGERVIVYGDKGIFSSGKEYFAVTDRRTAFVRKQQVKSILHTDIDSLKIEGGGNCYLNEDYGKGLVSLDANGRFQGALIALICMLSFEAEPERGRIRIV